MEQRFYEEKIFQVSGSPGYPSLKLVVRLRRPFGHRGGELPRYWLSIAGQESATEDWPELHLAINATYLAGLNAWLQGVADQIVESWVSWFMLNQNADPQDRPIVRGLFCSLGELVEKEFETGSWRKRRKTSKKK